MAEQWSSKSHVWVRFLLPLLRNFKNKNFIKKKISPLSKKSNTPDFLFKNYNYKFKGKVRSYGKARVASSFFFKKVRAPSLSSRHYSQLVHNRRRAFYLRILSHVPYSLEKVRIGRRARFGTSTYGISLLNKNFLFFFDSIEKLINRGSLVFRYTSVSGYSINNLLHFYFNNFLLIKETISVLGIVTKKNVKYRSSTSAFLFYRTRLEKKNNTRATKLFLRRDFRQHVGSPVLLRLHARRFLPNWLKFKLIRGKFRSKIFYLYDGSAKFLSLRSLPIRRYFKLADYFYIAKLFFKDMGFSKDLLSRTNVNVFMLNNEDVYNNDLVRITKHYRNWNQTELFFVDKVSKARKPFFNPGRLSVLSVFNDSVSNNNFFETNFYGILFPGLIRDKDIFDNTGTFISYRASSYLKYLFNLYGKFKRNLIRPFLNKYVNKLQLDWLERNNRALTTYPNHLNLLNKGYSRSKYLFSKTPLNKKFSLCSNFEALVIFFFKPLIFKFILLSNTGGYSNTLDYLNSGLPYFGQKYFFYSRGQSPRLLNLAPDKNFFFFVKKRLLKVFNYQKFHITVTPWYVNSLVRFMEYCSGKKVFIKFYSFVNNYLNFNERARCLMWSQKVKNFRRLLGPRLFLSESLQIIYIALKTKDPFFLSNWMVNMFQKVSFWKYKIFLRYLKYVLRYFFWSIFKELGVRGIKFQLKGKISVAGNARTRTVRHRVGRTSHATFDNKVVGILSLVRTFTGVQGLKVWIYF